MALPKVDVFGVGLSVATYNSAREEIVAAARERRSYAMSALATHGLMESVANVHLKRLVNDVDLVVPDGQPVRWAMNLLHRTGLRDRVFGPDLTGLVCEAAASEGIGIYLFGSTPKTIALLRDRLAERYPGLRISGAQADRFREATPQEDEEDIRRINESGAGIVLVGRGCPRQERWVAEHRGKINAAMMAVGAAFDYHAGNLSRAPDWMARNGLEWFYRLMQEPRRLFWRYFRTNSMFLWCLGTELLKKKVSRSHV